MKAFLVLVLLISVGCGKKTNDKSHPKPPVVSNESILNKFQAVVDGGTGPAGTPPFSGLNGVLAMDYSSIVLGVPVDVSAACPFAAGNVGTIGPEAVEFNRALLDGTTDEGILQYGNLGYVKPDSSHDTLCAALSKERYTYKMTGDVLKLCMVNYPYCATYKVVQ